jgi:hypothetical protein
MNTNTIFRKNILPLFAMALLILAGCSKDTYTETIDSSFEKEITFRSSNFNFTTPLRGDNEVPSVSTNAAGHVSVKISKDETSLYYKITAANLENVLAAHFHLAPAGVNGPVVAFLHSNPNQPSGPQNGVLDEGTITATNVIGVLSGDFAALVEAIRAGNIYVNVHTSNFPGGEIRGQL